VRNNGWDDRLRVGIRRAIVPDQNCKLAAGHLTAPLCLLLGGVFTANDQTVIFIYSTPLFMGKTGWLLALGKKVPVCLLRAGSASPVVYIRPVVCLKKQSGPSGFIGKPGKFLLTIK